MQSYQRQYLKEMGIDVWLDKNTPVATNESVVEVQVAEKSIATEVKATPSVLPEALDNLAKQVAAFVSNVVLQESRTQTVFGVGNPDADWLVIGEAPGADEDRQGEPFVGRAGRLLNSMLLGNGVA